MKAIYFLPLLSLLNLSSSQYMSSTKKPRTSALYPGDLIIGSLFSIHRQPSSSQMTCGPVWETYGIQRAEATFFILDRINSDPSILPHIKLGAEIRDTCWYAPVALQQTLELVRDSITPVQRKLCVEDEANINRTKAGVLVGVLGPGSSSIAIQVQNLLQLFEIPQVAYSATSRDLSDKSRFNTFLRVVPSDYYQARLLIDLVKHHNWTYISAIYTDENYGQSGMAALRVLAGESGVCIANEVGILSTAAKEDFDAVIKKVRPKDGTPRAHVIVCFCEGLTVRGLLASIRRKKLAGHMLFIGSDGWADRNDVTTGFEEEAHGSISIRIHSPSVPSFHRYYKNLRPETNQRNPWFKDFWEQKFNCSLETTGGDQRPCNENDTLTRGYNQDPKLNFIVRGLFAMAKGLHNMHQDLCPRAKGICPKMYNGTFNGTLYKEYLLKVNATALHAERVDFDKNGDPPERSTRYDIMNYQKQGNHYWRYEQIGRWVGGYLNLRSRNVQYSGADGVTADPTRVHSICSTPCPIGYYKVIDDPKKRCCWSCIECHPDAIQISETLCKKCDKGFYPSLNKTYCIQSTIEYLKWSDTESIVAVTFAILGLLATSLTALVFIKYNDTPVVKSSTRELSYLILFGMTISHGTVFIIITKPTSTTCSLSVILPGVSFAMIFASIFTKTNRIARILAGSKKRFPTIKPHFMSGTAQVVISSALTTCASAICVFCAWAFPSRASILYPRHSRAVLACATPTKTLLFSLAPSLALLAGCAALAVKTRSLPHNFNEAKFIGIATYTTCVIWIAFFPIYFGSESKAITLCMCITLSATVTLVFLFCPRLYIILLKPEKNSRAHFITTRSIRCHIGGGRQNFYSREAHHGHEDRATVKTISCQTSFEKIPFTTDLQKNSSTMGHFNDFSPNLLKSSQNSLCFDVSRTRIREENVSECSFTDEDSTTQIKDIFITLALTSVSKK